MAPYLVGVDLYNRMFFWEAHELWEPVWLAVGPVSRERRLMAGLIQLANGGLKLRMGRASAVRRLLGLAVEHLMEAAREDVSATTLMGLDVTALLRETTHVRRCIELQGRLPSFWPMLQLR